MRIIKKNNVWIDEFTKKPLKRIETLPQYLYHGTKESNIREICKYGLLSTRKTGKVEQWRVGEVEGISGSRENVIYFLMKMEAARAHAESVAYEIDTPVVFRTESKRLLERKCLLFADPEFADQAAPFAETESLLTSCFISPKDLSFSDYEGLQHENPKWQKCTD